MIPLNSSGNARLLRDFNRASISSMYLVVSNTSTSMKDCGEVATTYGGPRYSCYGRGTYDSAQTFKVRATPAVRDGEHASQAGIKEQSPGPAWLCLETTEIRGEPQRADTERLHREHHHR